MDKPNHLFHELFAQLGLPDDERGIGQFLRTHAPLAAQVKLADAPFWTPAQAQFLRESLAQDAQWAAPVEQLNAALRQPETKSP